MENSRIFILINILSIYIYWIVCYWGAANSSFYLGPTIAILYFIFHFLVISEKRKEFKYLSYCFVTGFIFESIFYYSGLIEYRGLLIEKYNFIPFWVLILWMGFSLTVFHSFKWIIGKYKIALIIGCLFTPLIYLSANRVGSISFTLSISNMYLILAFMWSICLPLLIYIATKLND